MRSLRLIEVAASAEIIRLKRKAGAAARSAMFMAAAGVFGFVTLGLLHASAWIWLAHHYGELRATLYLALGDAAISGGFYWFCRARPDPVAHAALMVRRQAVGQLRALSPTNMVRDLIGRLRPSRARLPTQ